MGGSTVILAAARRTNRPEEAHKRNEVIIMPIKEQANINGSFIVDLSTRARHAPVLMPVIKKIVILKISNPIFDSGRYFGKTKSIIVGTAAITPVIIKNKPVSLLFSLISFSFLKFCLYLLVKKLTQS